VLDGLRRLLRKFRSEWEMEFVGSGNEALARMEAQPFDVVVSDLQMPGMTGTQLLRRVMQRYPGTVRIVLSGSTQQAAIIESATVAHQFLSKPCDADLLKNCVVRCCALEEQLASSALRSLVNVTTNLPSLPAVYAELVDELKKPDASIDRVSALISKDVAMTTKILQFVNSSFFGLSRRIETPLQAASLLGLSLVRSLVLSAGVFSQYENATLPGFTLEGLMKHSLAVGSLAQAIAKDCKQPKDVVSDALLAGMLHDVGQLILATGLPEQFAVAVALVNDEGSTLAAAEQQVFGTTHANVGAYLLQLWNFPRSLVEAVAFHQTPDIHPTAEPTALFFLHVANALAAEPCIDRPPIDERFVASVGLADRISHWEELAGAVAAG
ncbi:MAG: HDOD domain-containing protein, partial [Planctomycetia bacterium]|nr:HDOD domain-containing protein [Planctomycetia bacterium]